MYTLLICIAALVIGYALYGKFVEKVFGPDPNRPTPAISKADGVDNVAMPAWKVFMIQFLNIDGTGSIFGAILGAMYGPSCYFWIVFGCIFGGAVHDYFTGMLSVRHNGADLPELIGTYLGGGVKKVMVVFSVFMLILVAAVFVYSPALILGELSSSGAPEKMRSATMIWIGIIFIYYFFATIVPVDQLIGRFYPFFAGAIAFMGLSLLACLFIKWPDGIPEVWDGLQNRTPANGSIFPCLFISIACGAISGFHGTQSPLMARCIPNEKYGRSIFYGSMVLEGVSALIWATISSYFFFDGGNVAMGAEDVVSTPAVVNTVCQSWLGALGGVLAIIGVVAAPITSGDTALRSARLTIKNAFHLKGDKRIDRITIAIPLFIATADLLIFNILDQKGFDVIWRYFGWANQTLSVFTLWMITVFLLRCRKGKYYLMTLLPACFMTSVCVTFILTSNIGFKLPVVTIPYIGVGVFTISILLFFVYKEKIRIKENNLGNI